MMKLMYFACEKYVNFAGHGKNCMNWIIPLPTEKGNVESTFNVIVFEVVSGGK
jgi:hypothetical protein